MSLQDTIRPIVFFDGVCNLCNRSVQFVIRHDKKKQFLFATLQSDLGQKARKELPGKAPDSFILFHNGKYYTRSAAALNVCKLLGGIWSLLYVGIIVPRFIRDSIYDLVSRNRYKWFGKQECMVPSPDLKARFLS
jgi:predicted DCC family thiol-disulfide oxidoreductase YuxK